MKPFKARHLHESAVRHEPHKCKKGKEGSAHKNVVRGTSRRVGLVLYPEALMYLLFVLRRPFHLGIIILGGSEATRLAHIMVEQGAA